MKTFPILRDARDRVTAPDGRREVPWEWVAPFAVAAYNNHFQTLDRLAQRGGLSPSELYCVVHERPWKTPPPRSEVEAWLAAWDGTPPPVKICDCDYPDPQRGNCGRCDGVLR